MSLADYIYGAISLSVSGGSLILMLTAFLSIHRSSLEMLNLIRARLERSEDILEDLAELAALHKKRLEELERSGTLSYPNKRKT